MIGDGNYVAIINYKWQLLLQEVLVLGIHSRG